MWRKRHLLWLIGHVCLVRRLNQVWCSYIVKANKWGGLYPVQFALTRTKGEYAAAQRRQVHFQQVTYNLSFTVKIIWP